MAYVTGSSLFFINCMGLRPSQWPDFQCMFWVGYGRGFPRSAAWINPNAPAYSKMTLGWGGRLSGPNDGALNNAVIDGPVPVVAPNLPSSSCMSCHSVAEWPMKSFLWYTATDPQAFAPEGFANSDFLVMWPPGSTQGGADNTPAWMHWFQSRPGTVPADAGTAAFDYDMHDLQIADRLEQGQRC
jgi:hypothetical protein